MLDSTQILVVDDTPANLEIITDTLAAAGYKVSTAISGEREYSSKREMRRRISAYQ